MDLRRALCFGQCLERASSQLLYKQNIRMAGGGIFVSNGGKEYPGKLTLHVFITCIVGAMGGLIFGYDIGISGGVTSMPTFLEKFFPKVYRRQQNVGGTNQYCKFDDLRLTMFTSSLYLAALLASVFASSVTRVMGRKRSMLFGGLLFLAGAIINAFAQNVTMLIIGRILLGFGVGFSNQAAPVYLCEMAPYKYRGALNMLFQLCITIGILAANLINYFTAQLKSDAGWRISLGCAAVPALFFTVGSMFLPDTPNSLIERGKHVEALEKLRNIRGLEDVDQEFNDLVEASNASKQIKHPWANLLKTNKYRPQLVMVIAIPFFQQLTGMNVFMFYAPVLFKTIGFGSNASLASSLISGGINCVSTLVSIFTVDKFGRRFLFIEGGIQMFICQLIVTLCIALKFGVDGNPGELPAWYAAIVVAVICIYVAGFAWSWGPLGWLVPGEILPLEVRSAGQSINVCVNMIFTFVIAQCFLKMLCVMKFGLFIFFSGFVLGMTVFIWYLLPETKGIPIEEMADIWKAHPFWRKYVIADDDDKPDHIQMTSKIDP